MQTSSLPYPKSRKILVVEDEGLIAHDLTSRLEALNHEVVAVASTAEEAIERAGEADIVLMDIGIDGPVDGIQAAAEIRKRHGVPVIFLTAHADRATLERAKAADPFGYIAKPLAPASLNSSIEIALHKHGVERELAEREAWLRTILGSIGDAVVVTDPDGRVSMLNRAAEELTEHVHGEAQGQPIAKIARIIADTGQDTREDIENDDGEGKTGGGFEDESAEPVALAILSDAPVLLDHGWKLITPSGREKAIEGSVAPVKVSGTAIGAVLVFRDVSARRWEDRHLRQTLKLEAAGRLAAGVAAEYSNLLGIIRLQSEHLLRQFGEYTPARKAAEEIGRAAAAADQINRRLTFFGTRQVSPREALSLNSMVRKTAKLIELVSGTSIELTIRTTSTRGRINVDPEHLEQAIVTLVMHACATMPAGGRLVIETGNADISSRGRPTGFALLAVTYTGDEPDPEKMFEPSASGDEGLMLSTVHTMVAEYGGFISAQAVAGGGCRLEMLLPHQEDPAQMAQPGVLPPSSHGAPSILLVDNRDRIRLHLHNFFEAHGYNLLEAADEAEALAIGQMHESGLDLLIAESAQAEAIAQRMGGRLKLLRIVERPEVGPAEIRRPFSQQALLQKVEELLRPRQELGSAAAG